jgi:phage/plasmid-associated DNA primase
MLTGGDPIRARFMRQDEFEFQPQLKLLISGNHKPGLRSVDEAIKRRFHLIPFTLTIPPVERDADLTEKLKSEWLEARGFEPARTAGRGFRGLRIIPKPSTHHWSDR